MHNTIINRNDASFLINVGGSMKTLVKSLLISLMLLMTPFSFTPTLAHGGGMHGGGFHGGGFGGGFHGGFGGGGFHGAGFRNGGFHGSVFRGGGFVYPYQYNYPYNNCTTIVTYNYQCGDEGCGYYPVYSQQCYGE
jgi:hypothetical protein